MSSLNPQTLSHKTASSNLDDQDDPHNIEWSSSSDEEESSLKVLAQGVKSVHKLVSPGKGLLKKGIEDPSTAAASRKKSIFQKALSPFSNKSRSTVEDDDADASSAPPSALLDPPPPPPPLPELTAVDLLASPAAPNASSDNWRWFTLRDLCARLCAGVNLGIRRRSNKSFSGAFTGDEATLWILSDEKNPATNEGKADADQISLSKQPSVRANGASPGGWLGGGHLCSHMCMVGTIVCVFGTNPLRVPQRKPFSSPRPSSTTGS